MILNILVDMSALYNLSGISMAGIGTGMGSEAKLGLTTTVREQVTSIEVAVSSPRTQPTRLRRPS